MPTSEQQDELNDFNFHFFGGDPRIIGYPKQTRSEPLSGKTIGHYKYDPENEDLVIVIPPDKDPA